MILEYMLLFSHPVTSDTLWPHGPQHARLPCPSPSPGVCPSSCSLPQWCHPVISSSVALFSFFPQSFPASMFATDDQNTGASASPSVLPVNILGWSPLRLADLILLAKGLSRVFSSTTVQRHQILWHSAFSTVQLSLPYMTTGKTITLTIQTIVGRLMPQLFNTLSRFVITFLPRGNHLLISWLQSPSTVILEPKKRKSVTVSTFSPSICHEVVGPDAMQLVLILSFKLTF